MTTITDDELNAFWLMIGAILVFFVRKRTCHTTSICVQRLPHTFPPANTSQMQTGFAMLEAGSVDPKNTHNILLKVSLTPFL